MHKRLNLIVYHTDIVHGDIKPANVLIFEDETGLVAKVIDFGCSCFGSKDNDLVLLSRTAQWAAPEIGDAHMSIRAAKLTDIYSYGMVCAWIFFGQDMPAADFVRLPSNFEHAAERLMRIGETEIEESQDTFLMLSTSVHSLREFFKSSFQAAHERRARNVKSLLDQLDRVLTGWNTRCVVLDDLPAVHHILTLNKAGNFESQPPFLCRLVLDRK